MRRVETLIKIADNIELVMVDNRKEIELCIIALMCRGHILIEDVPGVGKTSLASALAKSLSCSFNRLQFTPDIMPSDITGFSVYNPKTGEFDFKPGAIFSQIVLADEINRTSPKTQASLLEAMQENQVSVDGTTYELDQPFMVLATQNPVEHLGTYPLPEAQMDRFFMRISLGYPSKENEIKMLERFGKKSPMETLEAVATAAGVIELQRLTEQVYVDSVIMNYIVNLVQATRDNRYVTLGASPRASIALYKAAQAWALYNKRSYALPDDVIDMAPHVLSHRIMLKQEAKLNKIGQKDVVKMAVDSVPVPIVRKR